MKVVPSQGGGVVGGASSSAGAESWTTTLKICEDIKTVCQDLY